MYKKFYISNRKLEKGNLKEVPSSNLSLRSVWSNMIIKFILDLCRHSKKLELILDFVRGLFTFRLKGTRGLF